ncbi:hypothetical protein ASPWEDRAFT_181891 [Aspergillus wentii DTO 134E9]|uniref:DUF3604 domain-containing protein n=1 Tax=Aspergillus wentii DTO 134E9 TaxID=1073089 RepID=A0A1L9RPR2_ASPWE|nr:uncharacterized protein ASPWEDRAFT_181891 [Aspergillus wentii DTO 134E9]OJJ36945.1 hypothetical protein ASPWEDRAFT_181891 [Aspergillus wentii DTO 134E9]
MHLTQSQLQLAGPYFAPTGLYEYTKSLPFLGTITSDTTTLTAGEWTEISLKYTVGASGLADGAWIKGTFKFYSDWALFQTSDRTKDNFISAEYIPRPLLPGQTPATVQSLGVRFDQKGHERPFQKAVIIDIHDGYLNPGDVILIRLGDRRFGGRGTRVQSFVERDFRWRFYIDPVGTSRFAPIQDLSWDVVAGSPYRLGLVSPRLVRDGVAFAIHAHAEDIWGNVTRDIRGFFELDIKGDVIGQSTAEGWTNTIFDNLTLPHGDYTYTITFQSDDGKIHLLNTAHLTISSNLSIPRILFGDLHVHSDDTVGTESSLYNFTYGRDIAALDILGYTANDFQITHERWVATVNLIKSLNQPGKFVIFPGTEWCGNSAAGGDHNVVFLNDPTTNPPAFPVTQDGTVARSFEWSVDGPKDLVPGAWPLDEVYAIYGQDTEKHLLIPHVGGRRCNLSWHHPGLERLLEIGSAWGQFEWLLRDALARGWRMGVSANSDEHRGRCGGGVPGTAVFGTRGGLTGVLADRLERGDVAAALRSRHTFATTGQRLVGLVKVKGGDAIQGDEITWPKGKPVEFEYLFLGDRGFASIEALNTTGLAWSRHFWSESQQSPSILRVTWGGARLYDRYREAIWNGRIELSEAVIDRLEPFGGIEDNPEDQVIQSGSQAATFSSHTSGDADGVHVHFSSGVPSSIAISGNIGGYVKVGDALAGNPHQHQPTFSLEASWDEIQVPGGKAIEIKGGCELFVRVEAIPDISLPRRVEGDVAVTGDAVYFVGREWSGEKVVTSPIFMDYVDSSPL